MVASGANPLMYFVLRVFKNVTPLDAAAVAVAEEPLSGLTGEVVLEAD
jgi:hypothetical protein